jgi:hypothetical protein
MARPVDRRIFCAGFFRAAVGILAVGLAPVAKAQASRGLDGTWGGAGDGVTAQIIIVGAVVVGFFWRDDYLDATDAKVSPDGRGLFFRFKTGHAMLTLTGERAAILDVIDGKTEFHLKLERD